MKYKYADTDNYWTDESENLPYINLEFLNKIRGLKEVKNKMVESLQEQNNTTAWYSPEPTVSFRLQRSLSKLTIDLLVELNVFSQNKSELFWNFLPVYGEKLLLFKDLPTRRHQAEYVWLRTNPKSTSWQFVDFLKIKKNESVIDLGCGTGLNAFRAAKHSNQVTGIDLNPRAINLAKFNEQLNSFSNTTFYQSAWSDFAKKDFNHIISQPPFDPDFDDSNKILAFNGGKDYGLEATIELITKYLPKNKNQSLHLYVHSFAKGQDLLLEEILKNKLPANNSYEIRLIKKYQIDDWWAEYRVRHNLNVRMVLPDEWRCFTGVFGMYLKIV